jgi:hypothetical protein
MKKQYIACFGDLIIHTDNWEHGEDPKSGRYYNISPSISTVYFDTIDELREIVATKFTDDVDTKSIYINDPDDNTMFITWYTIDEYGAKGVSKNNEARFKNGEIDLYRCCLDVFVYKVVKVNCSKEFKGDLD